MMCRAQLRSSCIWEKIGRKTNNKWTVERFADLFAHHQSHSNQKKTSPFAREKKKKRFWHNAGVFTLGGESFIKETETAPVFFCMFHRPVPWCSKVFQPNPYRFQREIAAMNCDPKNQRPCPVDRTKAELKTMNSRFLYWFLSLPWKTGFSLKTQSFFDTKKSAKPGKSREELMDTSKKRVGDCESVSSWWLNQPILKNMLVKIGSFPQRSEWK